LGGWPFAHHADRSHKHCGDVESPWPARRKCKGEKKVGCFFDGHDIVLALCVKAEAAWLPTEYLPVKAVQDLPTFVCFFGGPAYLFFYQKKKKLYLALRSEFVKERNEM